MNKLSIGILLALMATATLGTTAMTVPASAEPNNPIADENVHQNTPGGFGGHQDRAYHEGTCQGGSDSAACDFDIITDPGNSDNHRQDN